MDTEKLSIFLKVVDIGSILGASRQLGMSRSSLRRALDGLEAELGVQLLHRDASGFRLTGAGARVVEQGRPLLEATRALREAARSNAREPRGVLRVLEPVGLPLEIHVRGMLTIHELLPEQRFVVRHLEDPIEHLREPCELILHEGPPPDRKTWFSRVVVRGPLQLIASRAYLERRGTPSDLSELDQHELLAWQRPNQDPCEWPLLNGGKVRIEPWYTSSDPNLLASLCARGGRNPAGPADAAV